LIDLPSLVQSIVAVPEDNVSVVNISVSVNIETFVVEHSDGSSVGVEPSHSLVDFSSVLSGNSSDTDSISVSLSVGECVASSVVLSDSLGS